MMEKEYRYVRYIPIRNALHLRPLALQARQSTSLKPPRTEIGDRYCAENVSALTRVAAARKSWPLSS
jgi:hypothetical protein